MVVHETQTIGKKFSRLTAARCLQAAYFENISWYNDLLLTCDFIVILHWNDVSQFQKIKDSKDICLRFGKLFALY